ncbi:MAG: TonB-dependent receptor [Bacteroidota bacterium]
MKNIACVIASMFIIYTVSAQITLNGVVFDKASSQLLSGAGVFIPELKRGTATDASGNFTFNNLPDGNFLLNIKYVGYASQNIPLKLYSDTTISVFLSFTAAELSDVIVTGVSKATEVRESPIAITLINETELEGITSTNLIEAISKLPGISSISTGAAISKPVIRGLGYNRVVTLNDGFKQEGQQWGDEHGIEIDEASIGQVEILRGPGSLMYGSDAIAGVINFLPHQPLSEGRVAVNAMLNYQSNNNLISSSLMNAGNIKGFNWTIRGSNKTAGNYSNRFDGKVWNTGFKEWNVNGGMGLTKKWGYSNISFTSFNQQIGLNEGVRDSSGNFIYDKAIGDSLFTFAAARNDLKGYNIAIPNQRINHHRVSMQNKIFIGRGSLVLNGGWQMNERREFGDAANSQVPGLHFLMHTGSLDVQYHLPEMKEWNTTFGISSLYQQSMNKGNEFVIPDYNLFDYGFFGVTQRRFKKIFFEAGLRFDNRFFNSESLYLNNNDEVTNAADTSASQRFNTLKRMFWNISGSIGFSYHVGDSWIIKLNAAKGFRAPVAAELASNGQHEGAFRYEYGNDKLKPESSYQIDAGLSYLSEHVNVTLDVFENTILNYIYIQKLRSVNGGDSLMEGEDGTAVPAFQLRQNNAVLAGAELTMDIHPHPADWLHFENSFGYVYAVNLNKPDSSKYLPFTPPAHYRGELRFDIPKTGEWIKNLFAGVRFDYFFHQKHVLLENNTETPTPDYGLLGVSAGFDFFAQGKTKVFTLIVAAENLTNTAYQSHMSRLKYADVNPANGKRGIWNMGRNISVKIIFPLEFDVKKRG